MGYQSECKFDPSYVPGPKEINVLRGVIVGLIDGHDWGSPAATYHCSVDWAYEAIPSLRIAFKNLHRAGLVFEHTWDEGDCSIGLTDEGERWCFRHLDLPGGNPYDHADHIRQTIGATFLRKSEKVESIPKGVKTASAWVSKTSYTMAEADAEKARVTEAGKTGQISRRSVRAYLAHITRRTAKAA